MALLRQVIGRSQTGRPGATTATSSL
jgi:hypothetical protein